MDPNENIKDDLIDVKNNEFEEKNKNQNRDDEDELNIAKMINELEINDELVESILNENQNFLDFSNLPADLEKAKTHLLASQVYDFGDKINENVKFCDDCLNIIPEEPIKRYTLCSDNKNLIELGIGVYLYFFFIKYLILICFILLLLDSLPSMLITLYYYSDLKEYCQNPKDNEEILKICKIFILNENNSFYMMSFENIKSYLRIVNLTAIKNSDLNLLNVNIFNLIATLSVYLINIFFMYIFNLLVKEALYKEVTAQDYTLMVSDMSFGFVGVNKNDIIEDLTIDGKKPDKIMLTYNINSFYEMKMKYIDYKNKLRYAHINNLNEVSIGFFEKCTKVELVKKMVELEARINLYNERRKDPDDRLLSLNPTLFLTFDDSDSLNNYMDLFPVGFVSKSILLIKYLLFRNFYSDNERSKMRKILNLNIELAPETTDINWENLHLKTIERTKKKAISFLIVFMILILSFGSLLGVSLIQNDQVKKYEGDSIMKYVVSFGFSALISFFNWVIGKVMTYLTEKERSASYSINVLSLSIKLVLLNFINSGPVPLLVTYFSGNWNQKEIICTNVFFFFLINTIFNPIYYFVNPFHWLNVFRRYYIEKKEDIQKYLMSMSQGELNT